MCDRPSGGRARGFSLVELLVVMTVIGVLSALAVSRYAGRQSIDEIGYLQRLAAASRYAQKLAVATRCPVRLRFTAGGSFRLNRPDAYSGGTCAANFDAEVVDPSTNQAPYAGTAPDSLAISTAGGFPVDRVFDAEGGISPDSDLVVTVGSRSLTIRRGSGQVLLQ